MKILQIFILSIVTISLTAQNVGVNITNPESTLDIRSTNVADPGQFNLSNLDKSRYVRFFSGSDTYPDPSMSWNVGHNLLFATYNDNTFDFTEYMRISQSGNVGIGIDNPQGQLHIKNISNLGSPQLRLTEIENDYARIKLESDEHPLAYWDIAAKADTLTEEAHLNFYFKNLLNSGNRLTIRGNGNIGINTTSPQSKLDITNTGEGAELLRFSTDRPWVFKQTNAGFLANLTLQPTIDDKIFDIVSPDGINVSAAFRASNLNPHAIFIPGQGRVGIGTYTPNARMAVEGDPSVSENILRVNVNYDGATDLVGVDCDSYPATGYGIGANFRGGYRGVRGISDAGNSTRQTIGVLGGGIGTDNIGTRVGLWGYAYGGATNWAGYFDSGNVYVNNDLRIGSGAINGAAGYKVAIDGKVIAEELRINLSQAWPDYVFDQAYDLMPLEQLEKSITENKHLPGIPSANEVESNGLIVGEMQTKMMEKIEELTLYILELNKNLIQVKEELKQLKKEND